MEENIAKGGKKAMLEYNLMFAGTAAYATVQVTDGYATKFIEKEIYTQDQYNKIKIFATDLQNKSGVFVSPSFDWKNATGSEIKYSYMGALCSIGVDKLDFMESHREADEIWTQLAQGAYKNNRELLLSLIHISEPTRRVVISYAVFCLKKIFFNDTATTEIYTRLFVGSVRCV